MKRQCIHAIALRHRAYNLIDKGIVLCSVLFNNFKWMLRGECSQRIIADLRQQLILNANQLHSQRQYLFHNTNAYTLHHFKHILSTLTQHKTQPRTHQLPEPTQLLNLLPLDTFMNISHSKFTSFPTNHTQDDDTSQEPQLPVEEKRRRRKTMATRVQLKKLQKFGVVFKYQPSVSNSSRTLMEISQLQEQQTRQIQAYRIMKTKEYDDRLKKEADDLEKKKTTMTINLSTENVIFDYQGKLSKLGKIKETRFKSLPHLTINSIETDNNDNKKRGRRHSVFKNTHEIQDKINITLRQMQVEKQRKNKKSQKGQAQVENQYLTQNVKVNPQSHDQIKNALFVKDHGILIKCEDKQVFCEKDPPHVPAKINRRLSKDQYRQFKSDEEKRRIIQNSKHKYIQRKKIQQQRPAEAIKEEQKKKEPLQQIQTLILKRLLGLVDSHGKADHSKVSVYNQNARSELLKQLKQKPYLTEESQSDHNKKASLSNVDRYNLLYVKYNGNPPAISFQTLAKELKVQNQQMMKGKKDSVLLSSKNKKSFNRETFLINTNHTKR